MMLCLYDAAKKVHHGGSRFLQGFRGRNALPGQCITPESAFRMNRLPEMEKPSPCATP
ncbi:MAG: hypothetical protein J0L88_14755 [Xanthomonadales bacterium]|nr:hypothetical protein [Xanthomonadales bacterium]